MITSNRNKPDFGDDWPCEVVNAIKGFLVVAPYGANASGKSNAVEALRSMQSAVVGSFRNWPVERGVPRDRSFAATGLKGRANGTARLGQPAVCFM
jgi:hypothetical protein